MNTPDASGPVLERREARWLALVSLALGSAGAIVLRLDALGFAPDAVPRGGGAPTGFLGVLLAILVLRPLASREGRPLRVRVVILTILAGLPATLLVAGVGGVAPLRAAGALAFVGGCGIAVADVVALGDASRTGLFARALVLGIALAAPLVGYIGDEFLRLPASWATISPFLLLPRIVDGDVPALALAGWIVVVAALRVARMKTPIAASVPGMCLLLTLPAVPASKSAFSGLAVSGAPLPVAVDLPSGFHGNVLVETSGRRTVFGPILGDRARFVLRPGVAGTWPSTVPVRLRSAAGGDTECGALELRPVAPGVSLALVIGGDAEAARVARDRLEASDGAGARRWVVPDLDALPANPAAFESVDAVALLPDASAVLGEPKQGALTAWLGSGRRAILVTTSGDDAWVKAFVDGPEARERLGLGRVWVVDRDALAREDYRVPLDPARATWVLESPAGPPMLPSLGRVAGPWLSKHAAAVLAMTAGLGFALAFAGRRSDRGRTWIVGAAILPFLGTAVVLLGPLHRSPIVATTAGVVELCAGSPHGRAETLVETTAVAAGSFSISRPEDSALVEWTEAPRDERLVDRVSPDDRRVRTEGFALETAQSRLFRVLAPFAAAGVVDARNLGEATEISSHLDVTLARCVLVSDGMVTATIGDLSPGSTTSIAPSQVSRTLRVESDDRLARGLTSEAVLMRLAAATGRFEASTTYLVGVASTRTSIVDVPESMASSHAGALWIVRISP
ncbi:MAG: hypothetical protein HY292_07260 [Planctomycetes bacterium]|nr:hypothetical protein [Planctomycetota bacterium]